MWFLTYTVVYRLWRPYRRYNLTWSARVVVFMDYCVALVLIINNGGLQSPYWALMALVALEYTLRFGYTLHSATSRYKFRELTYPVTY